MQNKTGKNWLYLTLSQLLMIALLLLAAVPAKAQLINGSFIKGANLPWLDGHYSYYLGIDPHNPSYGVAYSSSDMNKYLADMHKMGITVVRLWLNQSDQGCTINGSGYVTGVTSTFWANLDDTVRLAGNNGIKLYLTLNNGRSDWLYTPAMADAYRDNCLKPMIQRYKGNGAIFAMDLMNEIDGVVGGSSGNYGSGPSWSQAQAYIRDFASAIHGVDGGRLVSCSTGWHQWYNLSNFKGLGLDFYDFHNYQDAPSFPPASSLGMDKPVYIGECGQGTQSWNDSIQNTCELDALNSAKSGGYAGVGIWDYEYPGSSDIFAMVNANGSWRPVCYTIQNWSYSSGGGGGGGGGTIANGTYKIINRNSGLALDVTSAATANSSPVDQWSYGAGSNQKWTVTSLGGGQYKIIGVGSGRSLDVYGAGTANGAKIDIYDYSGNANQQWSFTATSGGYYRITPANATGSCLDVTGASTANGAVVELWSYGGGNNQQWILQAP